jgi:hypothetical protein
MKQAALIGVSLVSVACAAGAAFGDISGFTFANVGSDRLAQARLRTDLSVIDATPRTETHDADQDLLDANSAATLNASATTPSAGGGGTLTGSASQTSAILLGGAGSRVDVSGRADGSSPTTGFPEEASVDSTSFFSVDLFLAAGQYDLSALWDTSLGSGLGRASFSLRAVGGVVDNGFLFTAGDAFGGLDVGSAATTLTLAGDATKYVMTFDLDVTTGGVARPAASGFAIGSFSLVSVPAPGASALLAMAGLAAIRRRR